MSSILSRGISRLQRLTSLTPRRRDALPLPYFPEATRLFFTSPSILAAQNLGGITEPFQKHAWVYACVNALSTNIAGVPFDFYSGNKKNKLQVEEGDLPKLFETPNPMMGGFQLFEATMIFLGLTGEAMWVLDRGGPNEIPKEIWVFHPDRFKEKIDKTSGLIAAWEYRKQTKTVLLADYEVIFFRYFNPYNDYRGLSPLQAARSGLDQDYWAAQYNSAFFQNSAQPGGVLETTAYLDDDEHKRILAQVNDRHQGASKAHKIMLLEGGLSYKATGLNQKDMDYLEGRKYNREEILAVYKIPKGELGIEDDTGSYAKDKVRRKLFWETTLCPKMGLLEFVLWSQLFSKLPGAPIWGEFDLKAIPALQEDQTEKDERTKKYWGMGVPLNVLNEAFNLGLPEIEGGDVGYLPFNLVPVGTPPPKKAPPPAKAATVNLLPEQGPGFSSLPAPLLRLPATTKADASWLQYNHLQATFEEKFRKKIKRFFYEQRKVQLQLVEDKLSPRGLTRATLEDEVEQLLFDLDQANQELRGLVWPQYLVIADEAGKAMVAELGGDPVIFSLRDSSAMAILEEKLIKVTDINEVTREMLRVTLLEGLENGEAIRDLQDRIRETFNFAESRSLTIARTETGQAASPARIAGMQKMGVVEIEWGTAGDGKVRASHVNCAGAGRRRIGDPFPNGCLYPCDPGGPAGEVINCRCASIPVVE